MLDDRLEGRLRTALRGAAEELPQTITAAELERRLEARRRLRSGRRLSLIAAAIAVIAVGSMVGIANGWLTLPATSGHTPAPSASASPSPSSTISPLLATLPELTPTHADVATTALAWSDADATNPDQVSPTINDLAPLDARIAVSVICAGPRPVELRVAPVTAGSVLDARSIPCDTTVQTFIYDGADHPDVKALVTLIAPRQDAWRTMIEYITSRRPFGRPDDTILVSQRSSGAAGHELVVTIVHDDKTTETGAVLSEADVPAGTTVSFDHPPRVSVTGYLLVSLSDTDGNPAGAAVYDLLDPGADPRFFSDPSIVAFAWGPTGLLAADFTDKVLISDLADPSATPTVVPIAENVALTTMGPYHGITWTADGQGFVADRDVSGDFVRGVLGLDGTFTPDRNIAPFASVGTERLANLAGQSVGRVCAEAGPASDGKCRLIATNADGTSGQDWSPESQPLPADFIWSADAQRLWIVSIVERAGTASIRVQLGGPSNYVDVAEAAGLPVSAGTSVVFAGLTADDSRIAIDLGTSQTLVVNRITGETATFDGTFAGWGDPTGFTYPNPEAP